MCRYYTKVFCILILLSRNVKVLVSDEFSKKVSPRQTWKCKTFMGSNSYEGETGEVGHMALEKGMKERRKIG